MDAYERWVHDSDGDDDERFAPPVWFMVLVVLPFVGIAVGYL